MIWILVGLAVLVAVSLVATVMIRHFGLTSFNHDERFDRRSR